MNILCDIKSPCPSQKCENGKDICLEEEGRCEYQRLEDTNADDIDNFVINYKDGNSKKVDKGFFCEMKPDGEQFTMTFHMVDVAGRDLEAIVIGCIQLADKMGLLNNSKECVNDECPYHETDHDCEAAEGCAGYEGATDI